MMLEEQTMKKLTALLLILAVLATMLVGCGEKKETKPVDPKWTAPVYEVEETLENRQKALVATAKAYYYKGVLNQYGLQDMTIVDEYYGGNLRGRTMEGNTPEENTEDLTLYQWCSSYVYDVVYHTMGYKIANDYVFCRTGAIGKGDRVEDIVLEHYYKLVRDAEKDKAAIDAIVADLRPGDIVTWIQQGGGHSLMVIDDYDGDGVLNIMHRSGGRYNMTTGVDTLEDYGIKLDPITAFTDESASNCLYKKIEFSVIRVTNLDPAQYPLTESAKARCAWEGLRIDRTVTGGVLGSVVPGGELTYTIEITNHSDKNHENMPVMDAVAENCTLVSVDGKKATTTYPVWSVNIPAGETVTLTYTIQVNGQPGEQVVSAGGSVAGIPSNRLVTTIQSFTPEASALQNEANVEKARSESTSALEFVNKLYEAAYGKNPGIQKSEETMAACLQQAKEITFVPVKVYRPVENLFEASNSMMIPTYIGGRNIMTGANDRILETRMSDLQAGDIIIGQDLVNNKLLEYYWIFDGENLLQWSDGTVNKLDQTELTKLLSFDFFMGFRPSLAG